MQYRKLTIAGAALAAVMFVRVACCNGCKATALSLTAMIAVLCAPAYAQTTGCVVSTQPLAFGAYDVSSTSALTTIARIDVRCAVPVSLTLGLQSRQPGIAGQWRTMRRLGDGEPLAYALYQDASLSQLWGDGVRQSGRALSITNVSSVFVYGVMPPGQDPAIGEYRDQLTVVVAP